jgi:uracil-DNA glycosylase
MSELKKQMGEDWYNLMKDCIQSDYFKRLGRFLKDRRSSFDTRVFPDKEDIFRAFRECPLDTLKVVIISREPYPKVNQATGLALAYGGGGPIPVDMVNIHKEYENDIAGLDLLFDYSLKDWAKQGVLLLNTTLTIEEGKPNSHIKQWRKFTKHLFEKLSEEKVGIVYLCCGEQAYEYSKIFNKYKSNLVIKSPHPKNKEWLKSKPFTKINECLTEIAKGIDENPENYIIKW